VVGGGQRGQESDARSEKGAEMTRSAKLPGQLGISPSQGGR